MVNNKWTQFIDNLSIDEIVSVVVSLGSLPPKKDGQGNFVFQSICHQSQSWKLCLYLQTKTFFCYKEWKKFNLFELVMAVKNIDFISALHYIEKITGKSTNNTFVQAGWTVKAEEDWNIFDRYLNIPASPLKETKYSPKILDLYENKYYNGWIEENISIQSMQKYNIKYDRTENRIIIPHYDNNGTLIGVRCRNLSPDTDIKYCPLQLEDEWLTHCLSNNLYGLFQNEQAIIKSKKAFIVEGEKSVLQGETYFSDKNYIVACCGSSVSSAQIKLLVEMGVKEVQLAFDFDFERVGNYEDYLEYVVKTCSIAKKMLPYFTVYYIPPLEKDNRPYYKFSPTDFGKDRLLKMIDNKVHIKTESVDNLLFYAKQSLNNLRNRG